MKRFLISLAVGIVVTAVFLFTLLLVYKLLAAGWIKALWLLAWPAPLLAGVFPSMDRSVLVWLSISIALFTYVGIVTLVTLGLWRLTDRARRRRQTTSLPPTPPV